MALRILVAEDDPRIRSALVEILQREGYQVSSAASGLEAIRMFTVISCFATPGTRPRYPIAGHLTKPLALFANVLK